MPGWLAAWPCAWLRGCVPGCVPAWLRGVPVWLCGCVAACVRACVFGCLRGCVPVCLAACLLRSPCLRVRQVCALLTGLFGGSTLVPIKFSPAVPFQDGQHSVIFALSFGLCIVPVTLCFVGAAFAVNAAQGRPMPEFQVRQPASAGNACWARREESCDANGFVQRASFLITAVHSMRARTAGGDVRAAGDAVGRSVECRQHRLDICRAASTGVRSWVPGDPILRAGIRTVRDSVRHALSPHPCTGPSQAAKRSWISQAISAVV